MAGDQRDVAAQQQRKKRPCLGKRFSAILSLFTAFVLGVPIWHRLTQLDRSGLPHQEMRAAEETEANIPSVVYMWLIPSARDYDGTLCDEKLRKNLARNFLPILGRHAGDGHGSALAADGHITAVLDGLRRLGIDLFSDQALSIHAAWVTPKGCRTADPLKILRGRIVANRPTPMSLCPEIDLRALTETSSNSDVEALLSEALGNTPSLPGEYHIFGLDTTDTSPEGTMHTANARAVMGQTRVGWCLGRMWEQRPGDDRAQFSEEFANAVATVVNTFLHGSCNRKGTENQRSLQTPLVATDSLRILLTLCNAHPPTGSCRWDAEWLETVAFAPVVEALRPLGHVDVGSNVLHYTNSSVFGAWNESMSAYTLQPDQLPYFIASDWNLLPDNAVVPGTGSSSPHSLVPLVVYIPPPEQRPLKVNSPSGSTEWFTVTAWGSVMLHSPQQGCCDSADGASDSQTKSNALTSRCVNHRMMSRDELALITQFCVTELRAALGVCDTHKTMDKDAIILESAPATTSGFAQWEVDSLMRRQIRLQTQVAGSTLNSLSRLVESLPNLPIKAEVSKLVEESLLAMNASRAAASVGDYHVAAENARLAKNLAELAFFHPSIMADQSYPVQHLVAMYMPYFLPVTLPLLKGLQKESSRRFALWFRS